MIFSLGAAKIMSVVLVYGRRLVAVVAGSTTKFIESKVPAAIMLVMAA